MKNSLGLILIISLSSACTGSDHYIEGLDGDPNGGAHVLLQWATGFDPELHTEQVDIDNLGHVLSTHPNSGFNSGDGKDAMTLAARGIAVASDYCGDKVTITFPGGFSLVPPDFRQCPDLHIRALDDSLLLGGYDHHYNKVIIKLGFDGLVRWRASFP
jgi:hypothetical protein